MRPTTLVLTAFLFLSHFHVSEAAGGGQWQLLQDSIGISAMHMQLLHTDHVVIFDRTDFGVSNLSLPDGKCRVDPDDTALEIDCSAHSAEYDVATNSIRPLMVQTDVWCSSGSAMQDGRLVQTGGYNDGELRVRFFESCHECDWQEIVDGLAAPRWYSTNLLLPDGRQIIIGGRKQFNYEFYPKDEYTQSRKVYEFPFLLETYDPDVENNLYPFVFLNVDGNLFIFANNRAVLLDYVTNNVVKRYPQIPGGDPRSYPSTGSAILLPLKNLSHAQLVEAEVLVCGGAPKGSYIQAMNGTFVTALRTCARIKITDPDPLWVVETMPLARVMGDMTLLPNGQVLIINGAAAGTAGWEIGRDPILNPVLYRPDNVIGSRFEVQNPTTIPRMYHSTALLLKDGRVLVGGSNPHKYYRFINVLYPTELSLEAFHPSYLDAEYTSLRPTIGSQSTVFKYGDKITVEFSIVGEVSKDCVSVTIVAPSFATHSFSMNQRLLVLDSENVTSTGESTLQIQVRTPTSANLAPSGYYLLYVVHQNIPSEGIWVQLVQNFNQTVEERVPNYVSKRFTKSVNQY